MKTQIIVLTSSSEKRYIVDLSFHEVIRMWESSDTLLICDPCRYVSIQKKNVSVIEFHPLPVKE